MKRSDLDEIPLWLKVLFLGSMSGVALVGGIAFTVFHWYYLG